MATPMQRKYYEHYEMLLVAAILRRPPKAKPTPGFGWRSH